MYLLDVIVLKYAFRGSGVEALGLLHSCREWRSQLLAWLSAEAKGRQRSH